MVKYTTHEDARDELERLAGHVGGFQGIARRIGLEKEAEKLDEKDPRRKKLERAMHRDEPPTRLQTGLKTVLGLGLVAGLTGLTVFSGLQTWENFHAFQKADGNFLNTLLKGELNIDWLHNVGNQFGKQSNMLVKTVGYGAGTLAGIGIDTAVIMSAPWKKPLRRGRFF